MKRAILIGCGKSKRSYTCQAQDLYIGSLFKARRAYAEASGLEWRIISAEHGAIRPHWRLDPYDRTISDLDKQERSFWALDIVSDLVAEGATSVELHMGRDYVDPLRSVLQAVSIEVDWPLCGLSQGHQLQWYKQQREMKGKS